MPHATSAMPGGAAPRAPSSAESFRVIYHARTCPDCGSDDVTTSDIDTTDGLRETAHICTRCGAAWPVACVAEDLTPVLGSAS